MFSRTGIEVLDIRKLHELSMPQEAYLRRLLRSEMLARWLSPAAKALLGVFRVRNKMLILGAKQPGA